MGFGEKEDLEEKNMQAGRKRSWSCLKTKSLEPEQEMFDV